ncbi:hypothetical protein [Rheinheimera fenheensis]|uniref:hypothetical protein n=1 Tax=Rheinheimera fenheensis TaxID=3152295 RepID=UPI0032604567
MKFFDKFKKKKEPERVFPPVPDWKPEIVQPLEVVIDTIKYYSDGKRDFAVFKNGTVVLVPEGLTDEEVVQLAMESLRNVFHAHPDMRPQEMDDGNILVGYNHNVANVVLSSVVEKHWQVIDRNHQRALATSEVLITPLGNNVFNDFGKKSLFGRCFMFMDAQNPEVVEVVRKSI